MFIFRGTHVENNSSYEDSFITCQITPNYHEQLLHSFVNMQLASRNPLLRTGCCWLGIFFCKAYWATSFKLHFDFRALLRWTFAELSRKCPYPQTAISRGRIRGKANIRGLGVQASLLEAWLLHLELVSWDSESNVRQYQRQVQRCASRQWHLASCK